MDLVGNEKSGHGREIADNDNMIEDDGGREAAEHPEDRRADVCALVNPSRFYWACP